MFIKRASYASLIPFGWDVHLNNLDSDEMLIVKNKLKDGADSTIWCSIVDALQTAAIDATNDYKLKHLVEVFGLSGELLTSY